MSDMGDVCSRPARRPPQPAPFFFELDFVVNRNKRRHTRHDAKHTIARTAPHLAPAPAAPPTPAPPRWERDEEMGQRRRSTSTYGRVQ